MAPEGSAHHDDLGIDRVRALEYSFQGKPMFSLSADMTIATWTLEQILRTRIWSRSTYATATARTLRTAGYVLLPTFAVPHCDLVLPVATTGAGTAILAHFGPALDNPYVSAEGHARLMSGATIQAARESR